MDKFLSMVAEELFGECIHFAFCPDGQAVPEPLPEEASLVSGAVEKRRNDFLRGRSCGRQALARAGAAEGPILAGADGEPLWPEGFCGSISHTDGLACAAAASTADWLSLGIDLETRRRVIRHGAQRLILNPAELAWLPADPIRRKDLELLIFGIKESVFKLLYPVVKARFGFGSVSLPAPPEAGSIAWRLEKNLAPGWTAGRSFQGRYFMDDRWILSLVRLGPDD